MDKLDLDIANYNYEDLITLFHLHHEFSSKDLKEAKKIVYRVHPDKSNLPKEYFLFF